MRLACLLAALTLATPALAADPIIPDGVVLEKDLVYARPGGVALQLDLARPRAGAGPFPAVVCIHGGGFRAGKRDGWRPRVLKLAERGYVAVTVTYRLAPQHQFPAAVHDVKAAVRWLRKNARRYRIDPQRIGATGDSAGGHLAQFLGVTGGVDRFEGGDNPGPSSRVQAVVNWYGPSDLTRSYGRSVDAHEVLPLWLGGTAETARQRHVDASPLYWVTPDAAPTLVIQGTKDTYVEHAQALWLVERLRAAGVTAELLEIQDGGHGFKGEGARRAEEAMLAFFDRLLREAPEDSRALPR